MKKLIENFFKWEKETRDSIDVKRIYIDIAGDLVAGILLSQIIYWHLPNEKGKTKLRVKQEGKLWLAKKRTDWWEECRITPKQFDRSIKILEKKELVEKKCFYFAGSLTTHVRLNFETLISAIKSISQQEEVVISQKGKDQFTQRGTSITESTTKNLYKDNNNNTKILSTLVDQRIKNVVVDIFKKFGICDKRNKNLITSMPAKNNEVVAKEELSHAYKETAVTADSMPFVDDILLNSKEPKKDSIVIENNVNVNFDTYEKPKKVVDFKEKKELSVAKANVIDTYLEMEGRKKDILRLIKRMDKLTLAKLKCMKDAVLLIKIQYFDKGRKIKNLPGLVWAAYINGYEHQAVDPVHVKNERRIARQRKEWEERRSEPVAKKETSAAFLGAMQDFLKGKKQSLEPVLI